jgi:uncharacterized membrane protein YhaH (DUF805 family)
VGFLTEQVPGDRIAALLERRWRAFLLLFWVGAAMWLIWERWNGIRWFALGDTDDNMRMMQVRALLEGQGWYDLRQYRMNPPDGANIHWSRLVDLPIAAIKMLLTPLMGGRGAEKVAVTLAPLLPLGVLMAALTVTVRRLIAPTSFAVALALVFCAPSLRGMFVPLRIDHHGWQLAMLAVMVAALTDPKRARGGAILGIATATSLTIGLEMLPYLAIGGAAAVLMWIRDSGEARRLFTYGASLAGGCAFSWLVFTSNDNSLPMCDVLSPVWLSAMVLAGALCVALAAWSPGKPLARFAAAAAGGVALAAAFAGMWPHCLTGRLEQTPPELEELWLNRVREAMPLYRHGWKTTAITATLPVIGLVGYLLTMWRERRNPARLIPWAALFLLAAAAASLLLWQSRAGPAAQLLAIPGATVLAWLLVGWFMRRTTVLVRILGAAGAILVVSGTGTVYLTRYVPDPPGPSRAHVHTANMRCPTMPALRPIALQPKGNVLTFVDLGPRLITVTHHNAIVGPYHRNARQIIDVMRTWRGTPENALETVRRYRIDYVLICPNLSESTTYRVEAPDGFYVQLANGRVPGWLAPVTLPADSPYRMWRVVRR